MSPKIHSAMVALGANLSNREQSIQAAVQALTGHSEILSHQASRLYRTKPIEAQGPDFCNAVLGISTTLGPRDLLGLLLRIEKDLGRTRSTRNAPRTIDLDLIALDNITLSCPELTLPHPRAHQRAFVLIPLCEIAGAVMLGPQDPACQRPASAWLSELSESQRQEVEPW